jgi:manganese/zinc/iron transport system substrate-binding protein
MKHFRNMAKLASYLLIASLLVGCQGRSDHDPAAGQAEMSRDSPAGYKIVTTVGMVTDIVRQVAGDRAQVEGLMGPGVDPHLYKPGRSDIRKLTSANVVFYSGLLLEGKLTDALVRTATAGVKVYPVTELLDPQYLLEPAEFAGHFDPHVWMDPAAWAKSVDVVRDALIQYDPPGRLTYTRNAAELTAQINQLDAYGAQVLDSVPPEQRVLVTAHDAFNYFGRRYGYEVIGIQGLSTDSEAGVRDIENLVNLIVDRKVKAVFVESTVSPRNIQALVEGARARGHEVKIGGELFSDAMGQPGTYEGTYIGMLDHNITTVATALGGDAPAGGMQGKLNLRE